MSLIRGTSLLGFVELVDELGGDVDHLLARCHLRRSAVGDHDSFLSYRSVVAVLELAATATRTPDLGRRLAERQGIEILGPLGVAARTAPTVGAALAAVEHYMAVYSPALAVGVRADADGLATYEWRLRGDGPTGRLPSHRQAAELGLGVSLRVFRLLAGEDFLPVSVQLRHEPLADRASYVASFRCRVEFTAPSYGFRFAPAVLARPLGSDSAVHAAVHDYLDSIVLPATSTTVEAVAQLVRRMLPTGGLELGLVADHLAQHPRTLQRRLAAGGTSFAEVVDGVRREEAERYLLQTDMPLGQLAGVLGLSEQSVLTRACRRWFGATPTEVRRQGAKRLAGPTEVGGRA